LPCQESLKILRDDPIQDALLCMARGIDTAGFTDNWILMNALFVAIEHWMKAGHRNPWTFYD
jgi:hypothetical protein